MSEVPEGARQTIGEHAVTSSNSQTLVLARYGLIGLRAHLSSCHNTGATSSLGPVGSHTLNSWAKEVPGPVSGSLMVGGLALFGATQLRTGGAEPSGRVEGILLRTPLFLCDWCERNQVWVAQAGSMLCKASP